MVQDRIRNGFAGASADESKLVIIASSDTDPGTVYLFDKAQKKLEVLLAMRDPLVINQWGKCDLSLILPVMGHKFRAI